MRNETSSHELSKLQQPHLPRLVDAALDHKKQVASITLPENGLASSARVLEHRFENGLSLLFFEVHEQRISRNCLRQPC